MPILVKQSVKLAGRILAVRVDAGLANCVDPRREHRVVLDRSVTKEGTERFLAHHRTASAA